MAKTTRGEEGPPSIGYMMEGEKVDRSECTARTVTVQAGNEEYEAPQMNIEYDDKVAIGPSVTTGKDKEEVNRTISSVCCDFSHAKPAYVSELIRFLTDLGFTLEAKSPVSELVHKFAEERVTVNELELVELSLDKDLDSVTKGNVTIIRSGGGIEVRGEMRDKTIAPSVVNVFDGVSSDYFLFPDEDMKNEMRRAMEMNRQLQPPEYIETEKDVQTGASLSRKLQNKSIDDFSLSFSDDS